MKKFLSVLMALVLCVTMLPGMSLTARAGEVTTYTVTCNAATNGSVSANPSTGLKQGDTVTLTITPAANYVLDTLTVKQGETSVEVSGTDNTRTFTMPAGDVTVTASFKGCTYNINYNLDGGEIKGSYPTTYTYGVGATLPTDVTRDGYTFLGWYTSTSKDPMGSIGAGAAGDKFYHARWEAVAVPKITIEFQPMNQGTTQGKIIESLLYRVKVSDGSTPSYQWYQCDNANGTNPRAIVGATSSSFNLPTDLTAGQYYYYCVASAQGAESVTSRVSTVTVKLAYNLSYVAEPTVGGTVNGTVGSSNVSSAIEGTTIRLTATPADGYVLDTLTVTYGNNQSVKVENNQFTMPAADVTVTATFKKIAPAVEYTLCFDANGGSFGENEEDVIVQYEADFEIPSFKISRSGYTFKGWATTQNASAPDVDDTYTITNVYNEDTLYAVWEKNQPVEPAKYTVVFHPNAKYYFGSMENQEMVYGVAEKLNENEFARLSFIFRGWATEKNGPVVFKDGQSVKNLTAVDGGTVNLYAVWSYYGNIVIKTPEPTEAPTEAPTEEPTEAPTEEPTEEPTETPTEEPTEEPTEAPTDEPTEEPTEAPTEEPTEKPTVKPTRLPTQEPVEDDEKDEADKEDKPEDDSVPETRDNTLRNSLLVMAAMILASIQLAFRRRFRKN